MLLARNNKFWPDLFVIGEDESIRLWYVMDICKFNQLESLQIYSRKQHPSLETVNDDMTSFLPFKITTLESVRCFTSFKIADLYPVFIQTCG